MKRFVLSLALILAIGVSYAQTPEEKAAMKAAAKELKNNQKQARTDLAEAQKIYDAMNLKISEKTAGEGEIMSAYKDAQTLVQKALKSGFLEEKKWPEAYKMSSQMSLYLNNLYVSYIQESLPFDTAAYYENVKVLTESIHSELKYTKAVKGDVALEKHLADRKQNLAGSKDYFAYAGQFESLCKRYKTSLEAYDRYLSFNKDFPLVASEAKSRFTDGRIAYYAFMLAYDNKDYEAMDKYFDIAVSFEEGAEGVIQRKYMSFLERGDTAAWFEAVKVDCLKEPQKHEEDIQRLLAFKQSKGKAEMAAFADEVLAVAPDLKIANYGRAYVYFAEEKYDDALKYYAKCTEIDPTYYDAWYQCGLCKYRQALALNSTIGSIKDQKKAKAALETTKKFFGEAIPYFEKARECTPDEPQKWAYELKQCYTATGQEAKAAEMDKLL